MWKEEQERVTEITFSLKNIESLEQPFLLASMIACLISPTGLHSLLAGKKKSQTSPSLIRALPVNKVLLIKLSYFTWQQMYFFKRGFQKPSMIEIWLLKATLSIYIYVGISH